jgi:PAS domain S-box-containing protein
MAETAPVGPDHGADLFRLLVETVEEYAIFAMDPEGRIVHWNVGAARITGFDEADVLGRPLLIIFTPEDMKAGVPWEELEKAARTGRAEDERWQVRKDGTRFWATGTVVPLRRADGALVGFGKILRDRTDLKEQEQALRGRARDLAVADDRKNVFLATLAHELRNPLAPISNAIYLLKQADGSSAVRQLCETMERQVGQMVRLVDDLLELSRITRGKIELRLAPGSLHGVIEAAIETSRPLIEASGHVLHLHLSSEPITLNADAVRLAQVFSNLLNNAAKYTEPGGSITIKAWTESGDAVVEVSDTGIGISSSVLPRVFDMFSQGDSRHRHAQGGLGIGLTLVRTLVEMHGGTVRAASGGIGKGSTFVVRLPLAQASPAQLPAPQADEWHHPGRLQILVVDDNRDAANTLGMLLTMLGSHVEVVYSGAAALRACEKNPPDLVFLDLGMPQMDGYEVARLLRRMPHGQTIRIVALSGWGQERDRSETAAAGFDHHLIKPADIAALQSVLATAVNAHAGAN